VNVWTVHFIVWNAEATLSENADSAVICKNLISTAEEFVNSYLGGTNINVITVLGDYDGRQ
jgi:hypothetical protein